MHLLKGELWTEVFKADLVLFAANAMLRDNGDLVMGRGSAEEAKRLFPSLPAAMGHRIKHHNEQNPGKPYGITTADMTGKVGKPDHYLRIGAFQTKVEWREKSRIEIISFAVEKLIKHAGKFERIAMPFPGIGYGGLPRDEVLPHIEQLPDNVWIYEKP